MGGASCLYTLTSSRLNKWEVEDGYEHHVLSWDVQKGLTESIVDAIWVSVNLQFHQNLTKVQSLSTSRFLLSHFINKQGSESNYEEMKEGANVTYLDVKLSQ